MTEKVKDPVETPTKKVEEKKITVEHIFKTEGKTDKFADGTTVKPVKPVEVKPVEGGVEKVEPPTAKPVTPETKADKVTEPPVEPPEESPEMKKLREDFEAEKKKREEYESIVQVEALKHFKEEKEKLLKYVKDDDRRKYVDETIGEDPEMLERVKVMMGVLGKMPVKITEEVTTSGVEGAEVTSTVVDDQGGAIASAPAGKSTLPQGRAYPDGAGGLMKVIDDVYAIMRDPTKSQAEKAEANKMINQFFDSMIKGMKKSQKVPKISVMQCPQCSALIPASSNPRCPCGWRHLVQKM